MNQQRPINRLLNVKNSIQQNCDRRNSKDLMKSINCLLDKSPIKDSQSLLKILKIKEKIQQSSLPVKRNFEFQIQKKSDQQVIEQIQSDPIFRRKFQIWVQKFQNQKVGKLNNFSPVSSLIADSILEESDFHQLTLKKLKNSQNVHQIQLYERCINLIVVNLASISKN